MSAMTDSTLCHPHAAPSPFEFRGLRDLLLALCIVILAALSMQAANPAGPATLTGDATVQDWKGNSGSLSTAG